MLSKLWRKTEKGQSLGKRFSGLSKPNSLKFEHLSDPYLNSMCIKFRSDWSTGSYEKDRFSKSRSKRYYHHFGESRKKVNLSENVSRDGVDQMVWNSHSFFINVLTQCVSNFVHIGPLDHTKRYVYLTVVRSATIATLASQKKRSIFQKVVLAIDKTKLSKILTPLRSISLLNVYQISFRLDHRLI